MKTILKAGAAGMILAAAAAAPAVPLTFVYTDGATEGFNDPTVLSTGVTLGNTRKACFEYSITVWAARLGGTVPIKVRAKFNPLGGSGSGAVLAFASPNTVHNGFTGQPIASTWYPTPLANQLRGADLTTSAPNDWDIDVTFNTDVDNSTVLGGTDWYYGLDESASPDVSMVRVALHEVCHGLGMIDGIATSGALTSGIPYIYDRQLQQGTTGANPLTGMSNAGRAAAIISSNLFWLGSSVNTAFGSAKEMYAPNPYESGSSVSHFDNTGAEELMKPAIDSVRINFGLADNAMQDIGWTILGPATMPVLYWSGSFSGSVNEGATKIYNVTLTGSATTENATAILKISGTATEGVDYTLSGPHYNSATKTITLPGGTTTTQITLTALNDANSEGVETVLMKITGITGALFNATNATASASIQNTAGIEDWNAE